MTEDIESFCFMFNILMVVPDFIHDQYYPPCVLCTNHLLSLIIKKIKTLVKYNFPEIYKCQLNITHFQSPSRNKVA